ncbi:MAG: hypothetical protein B7L53_07715 [Thermofilum sp. NZ13]|nr:MAG: hypothetical protein B7L53_07715 [Thermofilum sp. NZ13]
MRASPRVAVVDKPHVVASSAALSHTPREGVASGFTFSLHSEREINLLNATHDGRAVGRRCR